MIGIISRKTYLCIQITRVQYTELTVRHSRALWPAGMVSVSDADEGGHQGRSCVLSEAAADNRWTRSVQPESPQVPPESEQHLNGNGSSRTAAAAAGASAASGSAPIPGAAARFRLEQLSRNPRAPLYRILTSAPLDREARASHQLRITCTDEGLAPQLTSETEFDVIVKVRRTRAAAFFASRGTNYLITFRRKGG